MNPGASKRTFSFKADQTSTALNLGCHIQLGIDHPYARVGDQAELSRLAYSSFSIPKAIAQSKVVDPLRSGDFSVPREYFALTSL